MQFFPGMSLAVAMMYSFQSISGLKEMPLILPRATLLRTVAPYSIPGKRMSSTYRAAPVTLSRPSLRGTEAPTIPCSDPAKFHSFAPRAAPQGLPLRRSPRGPCLKRYCDRNKNCFERLIVMRRKGFASVFASTEFARKATSFVYTFPTEKRHQNFSCQAFPEIRRYRVAIVEFSSCDLPFRLWIEHHHVRVKSRCAAALSSVHIKERASDTLGIPPHADRKSPRSICFIAGGQGE